MHRRVLIIGIDGGTWTILEPAIEQGHMPYLRSLRQAGSYGILQSTIPAITPAAWAAFQTGMNPGKTGVFDFCYWDIKQRRKRYVSSLSLERTIWERASQQGKRVAIINVPVTYPPKTINGYTVAGLLTPSTTSQFTYPPVLQQALLNAIPDYDIINLEKQRNLRGRRFKPFVQHMIHAIDTRARAAQFILDKEPWDIFMVHFQGTDVLQHRMWAFLQSGQPLFDPEKCDYIFSKFYRSLDQKIEEITNAFEKKANGDFITLIISDHGFQRNEKRFNLGKWLHKEGYLHFNRKFFWFPFAKNFLGKIDLLNVRKQLASKFKSHVGRSLSLEGPISWQNSRAISMGSSNEGFIYLLEENESKRHKTASELAARLSEIMDPETGAPIVKNIYRKGQIFSGSHLDFMPDLTAEPADGYTFVGYYKASAKLTETVSARDDLHVGKHHRDGIVVATGNHIEHVENIKAQIVDMAPTILYYLGLPIDEEIDGRVLDEIFCKDFLNAQPICKSAGNKTKMKYTKSEQIYSEQDQQQIEQRLRDLGYL
jgi:predicted AlkP superfamily phosphohydrolase/phosphomutase